MIKLIISASIQEHLDIQEKLESMSLAREIVFQSEIDQPILEHSGKSYIGLQSIREYLNEFESFHQQWYNCHCG